jgi:hypothetical protein
VEFLLIEPCLEGCAQGLGGGFVRVEESVTGFVDGHPFARRWVDLIMDVECQQTTRLCRRSCSFAHHHDAPLGRHFVIAVAQGDASEVEHGETALACYWLRVSPTREICLQVFVVTDVLVLPPDPI